MPLCLTINSTNYRSDREGILFNDRSFNIPVSKDVWDEGKQRIKARNFAIFAPTGEGKSFLANNILRQYFEAGVRLVLIDLGGSYAKFAQLYPDEHVILRYEQGKNLGINPFYISGESDLSPERLEDLALFLLELMAEDKASKAKQVALKKVLLYYYKEVRTAHSLASLYRFVDRHKNTLVEKVQVSEADFSVYNFLHLLSEYVDGGLYSFLFNVGPDQTYKIEDKRLIVFELDEVKDNKEILSVMLKLIKSAVQRTIWRNRSERGIILFDEFAKQLKFSNVLESVEFYYQAIRKQNGAIGIILQSINQLPENAKAVKLVWTGIGAVLTIMALLSLFGNVFEITFHQWISRFVDAFQRIFYPLVDLMNIFEIELSDGHKDILTLLVFIGNRYLGVVLHRYVKDENGIQYWKEKLGVTKRTVVILLTVLLRIVFLLLALYAFWLFFLWDGIEVLDQVTFFTWLVLGLFLAPPLIIAFQGLTAYMNPTIQVFWYKMRYRVKPRFALLRRIKTAQMELCKNVPEFRYYLQTYAKTLLVNIILVLVTLLILGINYQLYGKG